MKKSVVILLLSMVLMVCGCQETEKEPEIPTPSVTEVPTEEEVSADESVEKAETENEVEESKEAEAGEATEAVIEVEEVGENEDAAESNVYKAQMDLVYQALSEKWSVDKYYDNQISSLISNHYEGNALDNVGYALKDIDGDGKEELLISAVSKEASGGMLYDVYTAPNGEVVQVLSGHERNRYYLQWLEEGAYMIANEASNSAYNSAWYYYSLVDGQLALSQGVVFNAEADEENPWFLTYDEDWDASNDTSDVDGMAESIIDAYMKTYTTLEYTAFSNYNP